MEKGKKGHQYLDAMRSVTRISPPIRGGKIWPRRKENVKRKETITKRTRTLSRSEMERLLRPGVGGSGAPVRFKQSMPAGKGIACCKDVAAEPKAAKRIRRYVWTDYAGSGSHHSADCLLPAMIDDCAVEIGQQCVQASVANLPLRCCLGVTSQHDMVYSVCSFLGALR